MKDSGKGFTEDPLFKLMKRITRVGFDRERRLTSARQLKDYLHEPELKSSKVNYIEYNIDAKRQFLVLLFKILVQIFIVFTIALEEVNL